MIKAWIDAIAKLLVIQVWTSYLLNLQPKLSKIHEKIHFENRLLIKNPLLKRYNFEKYTFENTILKNIFLTNTLLTKKTFKKITLIHSGITPLREFFKGDRSEEGKRFSVKTHLVENR